MKFSKTNIKVNSPGKKEFLRQTQNLLLIISYCYSTNVAFILQKKNENLKENTSNFT